MSKALEWAGERGIRAPAAAESRKGFLGKAAQELALKNEEERPEH